MMLQTPGAEIHHYCPAYRDRKAVHVQMAGRLGEQALL